MSIVMVKKSAKNLFKLVKDKKITLSDINCYSDALNVVSKLNGFPNWHDYEIYLDSKARNKNNDVGFIDFEKILFGEQSEVSFKGKNFQVFSFDVDDVSYPLDLNYSILKSKVRDAIDKYAKEVVLYKKNGKKINVQEVLDELNTTPFFKRERKVYPSIVEDDYYDFPIALGVVNGFLKEKKVFSKYKNTNGLLFSAKNKHFSFMEKYFDNYISNKGSVIVIDSENKKNNDFLKQSAIKNNRLNDYIEFDFDVGGFPSFDPINEILDYFPKVFIKYFTVEDKSQSSMWNGRRISLGDVILNICLDLKNKGFVVTTEFLRKTISLQYLAVMGMDECNFTSKETKDCIRVFLKHLPGFNFNFKDFIFEYLDSTKDQFNYLTMVFDSTLSFFEYGINVGFFSVQDPQILFSKFLIDNNIVFIKNNKEKEGVDALLNAYLEIIFIKGEGDGFKKSKLNNKLIYIENAFENNNLNILFSEKYIHQARMLNLNFLLHTNKLLNFKEYWVSVFYSNSSEKFYFEKEFINEKVLLDIIRDTTVLNLQNSVDIIKTLETLNLKNFKDNDVLINANFIDERGIDMNEKYKIVKF